MPQGSGHKHPRLARCQHQCLAVLEGHFAELLGTKSGRQMCLIAFITEGAQIRRILDHIGIDSEPAHIAPARGPPLWDECTDAQMDDGAQIEPDWDLAAIRAAQK